MIPASSNSLIWVLRVSGKATGTVKGRHCIGVKSVISIGGASSLHFPIIFKEVLNVSAYSNIKSFNLFFASGGTEVKLKSSIF